MTNLDVVGWSKDKRNVVSPEAAKVLDVLTQGLAVGDARTFDKEGVFQPLHVECLRDCVYSLAHYFEQNGDLVPDPDMEFVRSEFGWSPMTFQNAIVSSEVLVLDLEKPDTLRVDVRMLHELVAFAELWLRNIQLQQRLEIP